MIDTNFVTQLKYPLTPTARLTINKQISSLSERIQASPPEHQPAILAFLGVTLGEKFSEPVIKTVQNLVAGQTTLDDVLRKLQEDYISLLILKNPEACKTNYTSSTFADKFNIGHFFVAQVVKPKEEHFLNWTDEQLRLLHTYFKAHKEEFKGVSGLDKCLQSLGYLDKKRVFFQKRPTQTLLDKANKIVQSQKSLILSGNASPSLLEARDFLYRTFEFGSPELKDYVKNSVQQYTSPSTSTTK